MQTAFGIMRIAVLALLIASVAAADFDDLAKQAAAALDHNPEEAITLYREALALRPGWAEGWFYLGASLYQVHRFPDALDALRRAAATAANDGAAWALMGLCEYDLGDMAGAARHIRKGEALGFSGDARFAVVARVRAAFAFLRSSEFAAAIDQLKPLAAAGDDSAPVIMAYGLSILRMPLAPEAIPASKQPLVELAGRAAWALHAQRPEQASALFERLIAEYRQAPWVQYAFGVYLLDRDPVRALAAFRSEAASHPAEVLPLLQIAALETANGAPEKALDPASEAVRLEPANAQGHLVLGRALLATGRLEQSIPELRTAVKLSPATARSHYELEQALRRAGRTVEARAEHEEFTRLKAQEDPLSLPGFEAR
jgi:tetratricopeptide (TPR) repeat protein